MEIVNLDIFKKQQQPADQTALIEEVEQLKLEVSKLHKELVNLTEQLASAEESREQAEKEAWANYSELVSIKKAAWDIIEETSTITGVENPFPALEAILMSIR